MTATTDTRPAAVRPRPPATALTAGLLAVLLGAVGGYGSIYFTGLEGWDAFGATYVATYLWIAVSGVAAGVALLGGSRLGLVGTLWFGLWNVCFTGFKIVAIQEWEALTFGFVGLLVLALAAHPATRAHARR